MNANAPLLPEPLRTQWLGRTARSHALVDSTNTAVWEWAHDAHAPAPHGAMVVAAAQSAGRGRQGRTWASPRGNLYVSLLLRPRVALGRCGAWPLVVGLTLAQSLEASSSVFGLGLKWPNDLLHAGRKLAGVLLESRSDPAALVVGLGLNLRTPRGGWNELEGRAVALDALGSFLDATAVLGAWLPSLESAWERFEREGFPPFREDYLRRSVLEGERIEWDLGSRILRAEVTGVGEDGALELRDDGGATHRAHAGEIHLGGRA